jgi:hypothetical protein
MRLPVLFSFGFAVELGSPGNFDQVLIVRGAMDFGLRGT